MSEERLDNEIKKGPRFGIRHIQVLLLLLNIAVTLITRLSISVTVVAMTNAVTTNLDFKEFNWSEIERSYIISSFYWGYIFTQFPAGFLNRHFGAKTVLFVCTFCNGILTLLTPYIVTRGSWQAYCAVRIVQGFLQGPLFPSINDHIANWSPEKERYVLGALSYNGLNFANVFSILLPGLIASSPLGWPGISYISGGMCLIWCILWLIFGARNPTTSRFITKDECQYIETSLKRESDYHKKKIPVPWRAMFTSVPFLALICTTFLEAWCFSTVQVQLPFYMNGVLNMNIKSNALYSSIPYVSEWIMLYIYTFLGNIVVERGWLTLTATRKTINSMGMWIPAVVLIVIGFLDSSNTSLAIFLLIVNGGAAAGTITGCVLSTIDLAPNHASVVIGITNTIGSIGPFLSPLIVGFIVTDVKNRSEWQIIFGILAAIYFLGNCIYLIFCKSEAQPWDAPDFLHKPNVEEKPAHDLGKEVYISNQKQMQEYHISPNQNAHMYM